MVSDQQLQTRFLVVSRANLLAFMCVALSAFILLNDAVSFHQRAMAGQPTFIGLQHPDGLGGFLDVGRVSPNGQFVVGSTRLRFEGTQEAFLWSATDELSVFGAPRTIASGVTDDGTVIGSIQRANEGSSPIIWKRDATSNTFPVIAQPNLGPGGVLRAISGDGQTVVGDVGGLGNRTAYVMTAPDFSPELIGTLGDDPYSLVADVSYDGSVIVGTSNSLNRGRPFIWSSSDSTPTELTGFPPSIQFNSPLSISADGRAVVGTAFDPTNPDQRVWLWKDGNITWIPMLEPALPGIGGIPFQVSNGGKVVAGAIGPLGKTAAVWTEQTGVRTVHQILTEAGIDDADGWELNVAGDVSADGCTIVGVGTDPGGNPAAWIVDFGSPPADPHANCIEGAVAPAPSGLLLTTIACLLLTLPNDLASRKR